MSSKKKRPFLKRNKNSYIVLFNKLLYSQGRFKQWLRQTEGIKILPSSSDERNYFKVQVMTSSAEECLELLNCVFSLNR